MGIAVLFVPWVLAPLVAVPALRGRVAAAFALVEAAAVGAQLVYRHGREFSNGVAQACPFRIYIGTGALLLSVFLAVSYWLARRDQESRRRLLVGLFVTCSALLPFWFVLAGLTYSS